MVFFILIPVIWSANAKITTYNILNFPESMGAERIEDLRTVFAYLVPDILVIQEMQSQAGVDIFLDSIANLSGQDYAAAPFNDGPDTDNSVIYRTDIVELTEAVYLPSATRNFARYKFRFTEGEREFYLYSVHLKASSGSANEQIRLEEATALRSYLGNHTAADEYLVMGDFNIYTCDEPAYRALTDAPADISRLYEMIGAAGDWHDNEQYANVHTQSTRISAQPDGGASGGLDDRFDIIFGNQNMIDAVGLYAVTGSYNICGNDGNHFDQSVNYGYNQAVPGPVANALYYASDHLPVSVNISDGEVQDGKQDIISILPNPMQEDARLRFSWQEDFIRARVVITNILGQRIAVIETTDPGGVTLQRRNIPVGIYFVHVTIETRFNKIQDHCKLAVID